MQLCGGGGEPLLFASFRYYFNQKTISVIGSQECFDLVDLVYDSSIGDDILKEALTALFFYIENSEKKSTVLFDWLPNDTKTKVALERLSEDNIIKYTFEAIDNVRIPIYKYHSWDDYFKSLSKSVRQNIRTSYNRLKRDNHSLTLNLYFGNKELPKNVINKSLSLYLKGQKTRYNNYGLSHWIHFKYLHYVSKTMREEFSFHASLQMDGVIIAMMQGYFDNNRKDIQIPRLAIDSEYSFYSPGYLLICETIKSLFLNNEVDSLDLIRGSEKYKLDLGGEKYQTYKCKIELL